MFARAFAVFPLPENLKEGVPKRNVLFFRYGDEVPLSFVCLFRGSAIGVFNTYGRFGKNGYLYNRIGRRPLGLLFHDKKR